MSENRSVVLIHGESLLWLEPAAARRHDLSDSEPRERLNTELQQNSHSVVFAVPGGDCRLLELDIAPEERRHLDASLPFMLEEALADDIESLHFARSELTKERAGVAIVAMASLDGWADMLADEASRMPWVPEPLLLPWSVGQWTLCLDDSGCLIRYGETLGTRIESELQTPFLQALFKESPATRVVVYGRDETLDRDTLSFLADVTLEWRRGGLGEAMMLNDGGNVLLDLRQGAYAPQLPYERWWGLWKSVAAVLVLALGVHLLAGWLDYRRLERENVALRSEIQAVYREVNPRGNAPEPELQLRRQLDGLRGGQSSASFSAVLEPLATQLSAVENAALASISYSERSGELRVNVVADTFVDVEKVRSGLVAAGFEAQLENSSRSGDGVRARLTIGARS
ncbi:MAG: type II secretion system protein GspL [Pseudomonadota bacterium]